MKMPVLLFFSPIVVVYAGVLRVARAADSTCSDARNGEGSFFLVLDGPFPSSRKQWEEVAAVRSSRCVASFSVSHQ